MKNKILSSFQELIKKLAPGGLVPPQDVPAEQSALGAALIDRNAADTLVSIIGAITDDTTPFYHIPHTPIYQAIYAIVEKGEVRPDLLTVTDRLRGNGMIDAIGGPVYLVELTTCVVTTVNTEAYARIILEHWLNREFIKQCELSKLKAFSGEYDVFDMLSEHEAVVSKLSDVRHSKTNKFRTVYDAGIDAMAYMNQASQNEGRLLGITSGLYELDQLTAGWQAGNLIIVAARPSQGKSAGALGFAKAAAQSSKPVSTAIISLEMSAKQLAMRLLCMDAGIDMQKARLGKLTDQDWKAVSHAQEKFRNLGIHILDVRSATEGDIRTACRRLSTKLSRTDRPLGQIVVDYLTLIDLPGDDEYRRRLADLAKGLKGIGGELEVPMIALSQLNRDVEKRKPPRPQLSDLMESSGIEAAADVILLMWRPETYGIVWDEARQCHTDGMAEFIVAKQRDGPTGTILAKFTKHNASFTDRPVNLFGTDQRFKEEDDRQANTQGGF